jgi:hypothetical protein
LSKDRDDLLEQFSDDLFGLIETAIKSNEGYREASIRLEEQFKSMNEDVSYLAKSVRDGNGKPGLLTRVILVEEKLAEQDKEEQTKAQLRWDVILVAVPGILAFVMAVVGL